MITKAKLLKGYVDINNKELRALFVEACTHYGIAPYSQDTLNKLGNYSALSISYNGKCIVRTSMLGSKLTLEDFKLKPKTNVEYVKIDKEEAAYWLAEHEDDVYLKDIVSDSYYTVDLQGYIDQLYVGGSVVIYRKIETEITWRDEALEFLRR